MEFINDSWAAAFHPSYDTPQDVIDSIVAGLTDRPYWERGNLTPDGCNRITWFKTPSGEWTSTPYDYYGARPFPPVPLIQLHYGHSGITRITLDGPFMYLPLSQRQKIARWMRKILGAKRLSVYRYYRSRCYHSSYFSIWPHPVSNDNITPADTIAIPIPDGFQAMVVMQPAEDGLPTGLYIPMEKPAAYMYLLSADLRDTPSKLFEDGVVQVSVCGPFRIRNFLQLD